MLRFSVGEKDRATVGVEASSYTIPGLSAYSSCDVSIAAIGRSGGETVRESLTIDVTGNNSYYYDI